MKDIGQSSMQYSEASKKSLEKGYMCINFLPVTTPKWEMLHELLDQYKSNLESYFKRNASENITLKE